MPEHRKVIESAVNSEWEQTPLSMNNMCGPKNVVAVLRQLDIMVGIIFPTALPVSWREQGGRI